MGPSIENFKKAWILSRIRAGGRKSIKKKYLRKQKKLGK